MSKIDSISLATRKFRSIYNPKIRVERSVIICRKDRDEKTAASYYTVTPASWKRAQRAFNQLGKK